MFNKFIFMTNKIISLNTLKCYVFCHLRFIVQIIISKYYSFLLPHQRNRVYSKMKSEERFRYTKFQTKGQYKYKHK